MTGEPADPLAGYEDWARFVLDRGIHRGPDARASELARVLAVPAPLPDPRVEFGEARDIDGVSVRRVSWSTGFGPTTGAWLLAPAERSSSPLPGVLGLHCHGGFKWLGAEQLVDLGDQDPPETAALKGAWYGGRSPASDLARRGFVVLVHDAFSWGSRKFPLTDRSAKLAGALAGIEARWELDGVQPTEAQRYNAAAGVHEDTLAKAAGVLGTSYAGMIAHDDLVALEVLAALPGVDPTRLGSFGFSGGGGRSVLLAALSGRLAASVVSCMMATFESLTPRYLDVHSWLLNSPGLARHSEWPRVVRPETPTLVQFGLRDELFPLQGMRDADAVLAAAPGYQGSFHDVGHEFGRTMQIEAWDFLSSRLG